MEEAAYPCWGAGFGPMFPEFNRVVYAIVGDCCYFSGIEKKLRTSTINAAESIIMAICKQEGVFPNRLRWFDLQTHHGYDSKQPGGFELDEVVFKHDSKVYWIPTLCPPDIFLLFREYIDT